MQQTDERTDIYNLGATLYHLLTGKSPALPPYEIYPIRQWNPALSAGLEKVIVKCTQKSPEDRFASCKELLFALEHFNELDDKFILGQKKKLAVFLLSSFLCLAGLYCGIYGLYSIGRENRRNYNDYLTDASILIAAQGDTTMIDPHIVEMYRLAIEVSPSSSQAYIQLLDYYLKKGKGQTRNGLTLISSMIASGKGNLRGNSDLMMKIGELYFSGNPMDEEFLPDYTRANQFFSLVDEKKFPQVQYYRTLSRYLSELNPDWNAMAEDMNNMVAYIDDGSNLEYKIMSYVKLADIYRSNASNLSQTGIEPFGYAIQLLEKSNQLLENPYIAEDVKEKYKPEVLVGLADSYYRKGNLKTEENSEENFMKSIGYYTQYMDYIPEKSTIVYQNKIADIYKSNQDYAKAGEIYKRIIEDYPQDAAAFVSYATMALIELKDIDLAKNLFEEATKIDGVASNSNYQSLLRKMLNAGVDIKNE